MWKIDVKKRSDYKKLLKKINSRLDWKANLEDMDLLYQQLINDKAFRKELMRKAIHLSSLWIPAAIYFMPKFILVPILLIILVGNVILEYGNFKRYPWARKSFGVLFFRTLRNKETSREVNSDDKELNEVNELQAKLNDVKSSLATQKEILEALRARVANNETLVQAKRQEMEEENMNATRELSDILAEITRLKNKASEQETFLGISNEDESYGKGLGA